VTQAVPSPVSGFYLSTAGFGVPMAQALQATVSKSADQSLANSTTLIDVTDLSATLPINSRWLMLGFLRTLGVAAGDVKVGFTGPTSSTLDWFQSGEQSGATTLIDSSYYGALTITDQAVYAGTGANAMCTPAGILTIGGTVGPFKAQFAQGASNASASWVLARSTLVFIRIG
jgi:hypothetical protein